MSKVFTITEGLENLGALRTGGQGSVYKGKRIGAIYSAVKLIPTPIHVEDQSDKNYRNFKNEVEKLIKVNESPNPNVVKMLSYGITESGSFPFIEMEYIDGPDLCELLQDPHEKLFELKELLKVAEQLAFALAHCHKVGVKHGDIKSNNVKYNVHTGNYVLLDFGLAIMSDEQRRTSIRNAGAIEFMAPEQNEGKMLLQSDIYSYGVILFELLGGQVPFPLAGNNDTGRNTVMVAHMEGEVPDVMKLRKQNLPSNWSEDQKEKEMQIPDWLLKLIYKCLQKDPELRFANGMALHEAFILGSISGDMLPSTYPSLEKLQDENEIYLQQITQMQAEVPPAPKRGITLSIFTFSLLMLTLLSLIAFIGYSEIKNNEQLPTEVKSVDTVPPAKDSSVLEIQEAAKQRRAMLHQQALDKATDSIMKEELRKDTTEDLTPDTSLGTQEF
ncbi:MAG: serine/threonine protein kinase [Flavobacterium sp.]|nr:MAG: serine/threonine protein kinase [Flavobacterium sp.]